MSRRTAAPNGAPKEESAPTNADGGMQRSIMNIAEGLTHALSGQDKQKMLLSENVGHFSMIRLVQSRWEEKRVY